MNSTRFVHVTPSISRLAGGLFESVRHLSRSVQQATRAQVIVVGLQDQRDHQDAPAWAPLHLRTSPVLGPRHFGYSPQLARDLHRYRPSLVHLHGLWKYTSWAVWRWSVRTTRPYLVSPHGMLEPWALAQSPWKKRLALQLYVGPCLRRAACLRATSHAEAAAIGRAGFRNPIAIVPNGVRCPELPRRPAPEPAPIGRALFLSRLHPKKGLLNLVRAWAAVRPAHWQLNVVGPDEAGHLAEARRLVRRLGLDHTIHFPGEAWGQAKTDLFRASDLFVLPSSSENFGLVIAEALAHGVPVITTRATPWSELHQHRCGWWIDLGVDPLIAALTTATSLPRAHLRQMGRRGHDLVQRHYAWEPIGRKMLALYEWILNQRPKPDYVLDPGAP